MAYRFIQLLLNNRKLHSAEKKTLEMVHREAPKGFLKLLSPLNPFASQLRYLQYVSAQRLIGEIEKLSPLKEPTSVLNYEERGGLPIEAFSRVQELFSGAEWGENSDDATLWLLKQLSELQNRLSPNTSPTDSEEDTSSLT